MDVEAVENAPVAPLRLAEQGEPVGHVLFDAGADHGWRVEVVGDGDCEAGFDDPRRTANAVGDLRPVAEADPRPRPWIPGESRGPADADIAALQETPGNGEGDNLQALVVDVQALDIDAEGDGEPVADPPGDRRRQVPADHRRLEQLEFAGPIRPALDLDGEGRVNPMPRVVLSSIWWVA